MTQGIDAEPTAQRPLPTVGVLAARNLLLKLMTAIALACAPHLAAAQAAAGGVPACNGCLSIRVGLPHVARGPAADIADNRFTEIALPRGGFRGFDAHNDTRAIDGGTPADMGGPERRVLAAGRPGSDDACGQWLNHAERVGTSVWGFIHDETACNYAAGQTHKSMSVAVSPDDGLTWNDLGQIITGTDAPTANRNTGEGDCTVIDGREGHFYAYCFRPRDGGLIVARAPVADPRPGQWKKFFKGDWSQPGLGGDATRLMAGSGVSAARWASTGQVVLTGWVRGGLGLFLGSDHTTFAPLPEPLLPLDPGVWRRPAPSELVAYPVLLDARTGSNQLGDSWMLVLAYIPPGETGDHKYLVFRDVAVSRSDGPVAPEVAVLLARWHSAALHDRWSTTAPVPGDGVGYLLDATSGYLMTMAPANEPSFELEDCVSDRPGHPDHLLARKGFCESHAYRRLRTAGWVFAASRTNTQPLYQCYSATDQSHFASNLPNCEGVGQMETLLGYDLVR